MNHSSISNHHAGHQGDIIVSMRNVSKKFCRHLKRSMAYGLLDLGANLVGMRADTSRLRPSEFWALQEVSFDMRRGEALGVLGLNGSGKTTMLRLLAGIFPPDKGEIIIKGTVGALISIGAGFHPHMTGRENIYLNGSLLGMSHSQIDASFHDIVEFADVGDFLDAPISTYSSGMRIRLGFSVATSMRPDILLLDEVFAVGDEVFRQRCFERLAHLLQDASIVLVTNRPQYVEQLCSRAIWLNKGQIVADGAVDDIVGRYIQESNRQGAAFAMRSGYSRRGSYDIRFTDDVHIYGCKSGDNNILPRGEALIVEAPFECRQSVDSVHVGVELRDLSSGECLTKVGREIPHISSNGSLRCTFHELPLRGGKSYAVSLKMTSRGVAIDNWQYVAQVNVVQAQPAKKSQPKLYRHEIVVDVDGMQYESK